MEVVTDDLITFDLLRDDIHTQAKLANCNTQVCRPTLYSKGSFELSFRGLV